MRYILQLSLGWLLLIGLDRGMNARFYLLLEPWEPGKNYPGMAERHQAVPNVLLLGEGYSWGGSAAVDSGVRAPCAAVAEPLAPEIYLLGSFQTCCNPVIV
jgi:hypothetical protein